MFTRTAFFTILGWERIFSPVEAEPVKETTSWQVRCSKRSPTDPQMSWSVPSGMTPDSTKISTMRNVSQDVGVAGFTMEGIPASIDGASFSSVPHEGKL